MDKRGVQIWEQMLELLAQTSATRGGRRWTTSRAITVGGRRGRTRVSADGACGLTVANHERLLLDRHVVRDNPVLSMCVSHTTIRMDAAGNRAPDKKRAIQGIDGTVALTKALAMVPTQPQPIDVAALIG